MPSFASSLSPWAAGFPGLIWSVEIPRSRLRVFNHWVFPGLDQDMSRFLKDVRFRKKIVCHEDFPLLVEFWDMIAARRPAAVLFHLNGEENPLILQGWPGVEDDSLYYGFLKQAFLPASYATGENRGSCQMDLGSGYPVFVVELDARAVLTGNAAARELFAPSCRTEGLFSLADIAPGELGERLLEAGGRALAEDVWAGTLAFSNGQRSTFNARVRLTACGPGGDNRTVRVALLNVNPGTLSAEPEPAVMQAKSVPPLREGLESLFAAHAAELDGLMFSDIQSARGRVEVYGVGPAFENLAWGAAHAYEGTIAQDIERFGLDSLTVEETLDSIKSIDWVLFIPHGVRSYFAKPCYTSQGLHAVLILASRRESSFGPDAEQRFADILNRFEPLIRAWRAAGGRA